MSNLKKIIYALIHPIYYFQSRKTIRLTGEYNSIRENCKFVSYNLASDIKIKMVPSGQIAKLLYIADFENDLVHKVSKFIKPGMNIIDAGANVGLYSILAGKIMKEKGKVWAFEPGMDTIKILKLNLGLNKIKCVEIVHAALSNEDGRVFDLVSSEKVKDAERFLTSPNSNIDLETNKVESIKAMTLDSYFKIHKNLKIDFIKMDIEGSELNALKGAFNILNNNKNIVILFENSSITLAKFNHTQKELHGYLNSLDFKLFAWDKTKHEWVSNDKMLISTGNLWACRNVELLPYSN